MREQQRRAVGIASADIGDRAVNGRQHLVVLNRNAVLTQRPRHCLGGHVAAVGEHASGRPEARIRSSTSTAPGWGWARPSGPRWASVPSTSNTKPRTSSSRRPSSTPRHRPLSHGARPPCRRSGERELGDGGPLGQLLKQADERARGRVARMELARPPVGRPRLATIASTCSAGMVSRNSSSSSEIRRPNRSRAPSRLIGFSSRSLFAEGARGRARRSRGRSAPGTRRSGRGNSARSHPRRSPIVRVDHVARRLAGHNCETGVTRIGSPSRRGRDSPRRAPRRTTPDGAAPRASAGSS